MMASIVEASEVTIYSFLPTVLKNLNPHTLKGPNYLPLEEMSIRECLEYDPHSRETQNTDREQGRVASMSFHLLLS